MKTQQNLQYLRKIEALFRFDAILLSLCGLFLIAFPGEARLSFPNQAWAVGQGFSLFGIGLLFTAVIAFLLSRTSDYRTSLGGLIAFSIGHGLLSLILQPVIWKQDFGSVQMRLGNCSMSDKVVCSPLFDFHLGMQNGAVSLIAALLAIAFLYALAISLVHRATGTPLQSLRTEWELQIREAAGQEERNRLARELHDSIKQQIFAIQTSIAAAQIRLTNGTEGTQAALEDARQSAREAFAEMEAMLDQLQATPLENQGLAGAIRKQCETLGFRTGATVNISVHELPDEKKLPPGAQAAVYRIAQESLSNIARHARASVVTVELGAGPDGGLLLRIQDDGKGFNTTSVTRGMGLRNLRTRAEEVGGLLTLRSTPRGRDLYGNPRRAEAFEQARNDQRQRR